MSISQRCRDLRSRIAERNRLLRAHQDAENVRARKDDLAQVRMGLQLRIEQRAILAQYSIPCGTLRDSDRIVATLEQVARDLSENYEEAIRQLGKLKRSLGTVSNHFTSVVTKAIQDVMGDIPAEDEIFLKQVELIPTYAAKVAEIRAERDAILDGSDPVSSAEGLKHFLKHLGTLRAASDALNPDEFPPDVLKFFRSTRHGGARLDDFSPSVREWLTQKNLLKHVRVTIVS